MLRRLEPLWDVAQPSILKHVRAHVPDDGSSGLTAGGDRLSDEDELADSFRWIPGAMDGVGTHHFGVGTENAAVDEMIAALRAAAPDRKGTRARRKLYAAARTGDAVQIADPLLDRIRSLGMRAELLQDTARWLVTESRHREPVKLGVALLGLSHTAEDRHVLKILGRHEEFTLFVAVALANTTADPDGELYALAQLVNAWGRVHLVERLKDTSDPEIREWIFRDGFRNAVMNEYLAYIAATTGELVRHLEELPDPEALDAARDIVSALLMGGPAEDIDDYPRPFSRRPVVEVIRARGWSGALSIQLSVVWAR